MEKFPAKEQHARGANLCSSEDAHPPTRLCRRHHQRCPSAVRLGGRGKIERKATSPPCSLGSPLRLAASGNPLLGPEFSPSQPHVWHNTSPMPYQDANLMAISSMTPPSAPVSSPRSQMGGDSAERDCPPLLTGPAAYASPRPAFACARLMLGGERSRVGTRGTDRTQKAYPPSWLAHRLSSWRMKRARRTPSRRYRNEAGPPPLL